MRVEIAFLFGPLSLVSSVVSAHSDRFTDFIWFELREEIWNRINPKIYSPIELFQSVKHFVQQARNVPRSHFANQSHAKRGVGSNLRRVDDEETT